MKKNDFWFISLITFSLLGIASKWNFWICLAVIANAVVVLFDVFKRFAKGQQVQ